MASGRKPSLKKRSELLLQQVRERAKTAADWMELSNAVFGTGGMMQEQFPDSSERTQFLKRPEYETLKQIIAGLPNRPEHAMEDYSGKLVVRLPKSLHAVLASEAEQEGVSLNQLIVAKLSAQLRNMAGV